MSSVRGMVERFNDLSLSLMKHTGGEKLAEHVYLFGSELSDREKPVPYTVSAIVHGNEIGGIASLNTFLELMLSKTIDFKIPFLAFLGNVEAATRGVRFVERDMNRSFNMNDFATHEARRAKEIEPFLLKSEFYLDIHQTKRPSKFGFFIFPYQKSSFDFARAMLPAQPIVTHWGSSFSSEGMCSDEFVNKRGGTGLTLELGQNGVDPYHVALGFQCIMAGYKVASSQVLGLDIAHAGRVGQLGDIYTWEQVVSYPEQGVVSLDEGWDNFSPIKQGQRMGTAGSQPFYAPASGYMIFPNYTPLVAGARRPAELYRIMKVVSAEELPT